MVEIEHESTKVSGIRHIYLTTHKKTQSNTKNNRNTNNTTVYHKKQVQHKETNKCIQD